MNLNGLNYYNTTNHSINIGGWRFADPTSGVILGSLLGPVIGPNDFIILSANESIHNFYNIPVEVLVLNLPSLNNTGDILTFTDFNEQLIDSVAYSPNWGGSNGHSLERISSEAGSNDPLNWGTSNSIFKATPGIINSLTKKDFDIAVDEILFDPEFPLQGDTISISAKVKNLGNNTANFSLQLFEDTNLDSIPDLFLETLQNLLVISDDSQSLISITELKIFNQRKHFLLKQNFDSDQDTTNNKVYNTIEPGLPAQSIVINEIMYTPVGGEPEWIELFNRTNLTINLNGWTVNDVFTTPVTATIDEDVFIQPNSYLVLSRSTSIYDYHDYPFRSFCSFNSNIK